MLSPCSGQRASLSEIAEGRPPGTDLRPRPGLSGCALRHSTPSGGTCERVGSEHPLNQEQLDTAIPHRLRNRGAALSRCPLPLGRQVSQIALHLSQQSGRESTPLRNTCCTMLIEVK